MSDHVSPSNARSSAAHAPCLIRSATAVVTVGPGDVVCRDKSPDTGYADGHPGGARSSVVALDGVAESAYGRFSIKEMVEAAFGAWVKVQSPLSDTPPKGALASWADKLMLLEAFGPLS